MLDEGLIQDLFCGKGVINGKELLMPPIPHIILTVTKHNRRVCHEFVKTDSKICKKEEDIIQFSPVFIFAAHESLMNKDSIICLI